MRVFSAPPRIVIPLLALGTHLLAASGLAQNASEAASRTPSSATPAANAPAPATYRNDALHLAYLYPASYVDATATVGPAFEATMSHEDLGAKAGSKDATRCVTLPFSAMDNAHGLALVLLVRADAGCLKKSFTAAQLPEFTLGEVKGLSDSGAKTQFGTPVAFTAESHPAELLRGTFTLPTGQTLHSMVACVLLKPDIACFQFLASSEDNLHTMAQFPVSLDGHPAVSLIPEALLGKP